MGIGDEIMASGQARLLNERTGLPVVIVDRYGRPRQHPIWDHNPRILQSTPEGVKYAKMINGANCRPYVAGKLRDRWLWRKFDIVPGEIYLTDEERAFAAPYAGAVLVEPNTKGTNEGNKDWGWPRWEAFVKMLSMPLIQVGTAATPRLPGTRFIDTPSFRQAAAILAVSRAFVGTEGALHHAAAAFNVPAVVIYGGFISPDITGYKGQRSLFTGSTACGLRYGCAHCRQSMARITPEMVLANLKEVLK